MFICMMMNRDRQTWLSSVLSLQHQVLAGLLLLSVQKHIRQEVKMLSCLLKTMHLHIR